MGLKISPLLSCLVLEFSVLPCQTLSLRAEGGQLCLSGRLCLLHRSQPLLCLLELVLNVRQALRQCQHIAVQLGCILLVGLQRFLSSGGLGLNLCSGLGELRQLLLLRLQVLQSAGELRLGLLARLRDLGQLLLGCLERLLQGPELSLKLITGLGCLRELLLRRLCRLLQGCNLCLGLLSSLRDLGQLLLRTSDPGLQVRQSSSGALLLIELPSQGAFSLLQADQFRLGFLPLVGGREPNA